MAMDKLLKRMESLHEKTGIKPKKLLAMGELEASAGEDGYGPRESGQFKEPKSVMADVDKPVKPEKVRSNSKSSY